MKYILKRTNANDKYTEGQLYKVLANKMVYMCDTLEPPANRVCSAIPAGTYTVDFTYSPKFHGWRPLLTGVPHRTAIRIHEGNRPQQTKGCILVGERLNIEGMLKNSRHHLQLICEELKEEYAAGVHSVITVKDPERVEKDDL